MTELATVGGGCYWCLEAIYKRIRGVESVHSGYSGGNVDNPTINQIYTGTTGHAECVQVTFDPDVISYREILEIFYVMHNPTTLNKQDYDEGKIYRSIIFYDGATQQKIAEEMTNGFAKNLWPDPVLTQLVPFEKFWPADKDMQNFYENNPYVGYCQVIINPKIQKLRQKFAGKLKSE